MLPFQGTGLMKPELAQLGFSTKGCKIAIQLVTIDILLNSNMWDAANAVVFLIFI
jgi:hypothetical protein